MAYGIACETIPFTFPVFPPRRGAKRNGPGHDIDYAGFAGLYEADPLTGAPAPLTEVACWAHARRKIYDIHVETKSPAAAHALEMIARLFAIEAGIKGRLPAERLAARRAKATPILSELRAFLDATMEKISGKSSLAGAFRYAASRWTALTRYVDNGLRRGNRQPGVAVMAGAVGGFSFHAATIRS